MKYIKTFESNDDIVIPLNIREEIKDIFLDMPKALNDDFYWNIDYQWEGHYPAGKYIKGTQIKNPYILISMVNKKYKTYHHFTYSRIEECVERLKRYLEMEYYDITVSECSILKYKIEIIKQ